VRARPELSWGYVFVGNVRCNNPRRPFYIDDSDSRAKRIGDPLCRSDSSLFELRSSVITSLAVFVFTAQRAIEPLKPSCSGPVAVNANLFRVDRLLHWSQSPLRSLHFGPGCAQF